MQSWGGVQLPRDSWGRVLAVLQHVVDVQGPEGGPDLPISQVPLTLGDIPLFSEI